MCVKIVLGFKFLERHQMDGAAKQARHQLDGMRQIRCIRAIGGQITKERIG